MPNGSLHMLAMLVLVAGPVGAQRPVELGIDAGPHLGLDSAGGTNIFVLFGLSFFTR